MKPRTVDHLMENNQVSSLLAHLSVHCMIEKIYVLKGAPRK